MITHLAAKNQLRLAWTWAG